MQYKLFFVDIRPSLKKYDLFLNMVKIELGKKNLNANYIEEIQKTLFTRISSINTKIILNESRFSDCQQFERYLNSTLHIQ